MDRRSPEPWHPDRSWADPFIATLALIIILAVGTALRARHRAHARPAEQVTLQGRLADLALAAPSLAAEAGVPLRTADPLQGFVDRTGPGWDRAILAVHAAAKGDLAQGARLAGDAPEAFQRIWGWAYEGRGSAPAAGAQEAVAKAMGRGYAATLLEARCLARSGGDPKPLETRARAWAVPRLAALMAGGLAGLCLFLGGLGFLAYLLLGKGASAPMPRFALPGRAVLIVMLGWFLCQLAAGYIVGPLVVLVPALRPVYLPLAYLFHASLGTAFLCLAEGLSFRELWARVVPGRSGRALAMGLGFLPVAFAMVVLAAILAGPFLHQAEPPQRELMELIGGTRGPVPLALLFLTIAVLAPAFEELLFRGFLLPWLGERLSGRRGGWVLAIAITGLAFGAMHLEPLGLPTLCTLGVVLGFAFRRTGNLFTAILVHGLWNGGLFLILRLVS